MAPEFRQTAWIEHASDAGNDVAKTVQHDADPFFLHPLRVVAFLRKGPGIPLDDNGEAADHRFGDAAGSRLADKKVSRAHELMHLLREADNADWEVPSAGTQFRGQLLIPAANKNQLKRQARFVNFFGDAINHAGAMPAEQHHRGGKFRL